MRYRSARSSFNTVSDTMFGSGRDNMSAHLAGLNSQRVDSRTDGRSGSGGFAESEAQAIKDVALSSYGYWHFALLGRPNSFRFRTSIMRVDAALLPGERPAGVRLAAN